MKLIILLLLCSVGFAASAQKQFFSPLHAIPVGPNGPATNKLTVTTYCCPSDAIEITSAAGATDADLQWVNIPLNGLTMGNIAYVTVCYQVIGKRSYISQVRLGEMSLPNSAVVKLDDPTDLKSQVPTCYTAKAGYTANATNTLSLRIVVAPGDKILIGGITIGH